MILCFLHFFTFFKFFSHVVVKSFGLQYGSTNISHLKAFVQFFSFAHHFPTLSKNMSISTLLLKTCMKVIGGHSASTSALPVRPKFAAILLSKTRCQLYGKFRYIFTKSGGGYQNRKRQVGSLIFKIEKNRLQILNRREIFHK